MDFESVFDVGWNLAVVDEGEYFTYGDVYSFGCVCLEASVVIETLCR